MDCTNCPTNELANNPAEMPAACAACVRKHLGTAAIMASAATAGIQMSVEELVLRAQILWSESRNGHTCHLWYAIGCLALGVRALTLAGQPVLAATLRTAQQALEADPATFPAIDLAPLAATKWMPSTPQITAELMEAERELRAFATESADWIVRDLRRMQSLPRGTLSPIPAIDGVLNTLSLTST